MSNQLRFDVEQERLQLDNDVPQITFNRDRIIEFNHRHQSVLGNYDLALKSGRILQLDPVVNRRSNLGAFRNRQLREASILAAALPALAVGLHGRGSLMELPEDQRTSQITNELKRANDRTAAQIMSEVLQTTTEDLPVGEEVVIESTITEGVRMKPGKEAGGNPTIAVGALFGKEEHQRRYGMIMPPNVTLLSMGNDVIDGTTKSVKGLHSSLTSLFVTESGVKRHLPDIYVQGWAAGTNFPEFNPRGTNLTEAAEIIANSYGYSDIRKLGAFFLDRARHHPAMDALNEAGIATPTDQDGDLFPTLVLGLDGLKFPGGQHLNSIIGEIGGSAEWAVGVLPLVWRGGQALGMLTSHSALTRSGASSEEKWKERFHFTEEEFMLIQDARFEHKPYFTIDDILERPFAGGVSAFGAITDNVYLPFMEGVRRHEDASVTVWTLVITSLGQMEAWELTFKPRHSIEKSVGLLISPKERLAELDGSDLKAAVGKLLSNGRQRRRYRVFFTNEYYPALIPVNNRLVVLHRAIDSLIERGAWNEMDREIIDITTELEPDWFMPHEY